MLHRPGRFDTTEFLCRVRIEDWQSLEVTRVQKRAESRNAPRLCAQRAAERVIR